MKKKYRPWLVLLLLIAVIALEAFWIFNRTTPASPLRPLNPLPVSTPGEARRKLPDIDRPEPAQSPEPEPMNPKENGY